MSGYSTSVIDRVCANLLSRSRTRRSRRRGGTMERLEDRLMLTVTPQVNGIPDWVEQGPGPIRNGGVTGMANQNNPVAGAVQSIAVHPSNPDIMLIGSVNGGIWKTTHATWSQNDGVNNDGVGATDDALENPSWTPVSDQLPSLAIGDIAFSPLDPTVLFAGTGNQSSSWFGGKNGLIYRSTDGGDNWVSWSSLGASDEAQQAITALVPANFATDTSTPTTTRDTQVLLAGTRGVLDHAWLGGLFRSVDGGRTWTLVSGGAGTGLPTGAITSILRDPTNPQRFYAAIAGDFDANSDGTDNDAVPWTNKGIYISTNAGATWALDSTGLSNLAAAQRILIAEQSGGGAMYVGIADSTGKVGATAGSGIFARATATGAWTQITGLPAVNAGGFARIHFSMAASPTDANLVYVGGDSPGNIYVGNRSTNAWTQLGSANANGTQPHADSRRMAFDSAGNLIEADDGGLFRLRNPTTAGTRRWESMNGDLRITEIGLSVAYDPINEIVIAGTQDNGSIEQTAIGSTIWTMPWGGDGNYQDAALDSFSGSDVVYRYSLANNLGVNTAGVFSSWFQRRRVNTSNATQATEFLKLANPATPNAVLSGVVNLTTGFLNIPIAVNAADPSRLMIAADNLYESFDRGDTIRSLNVPGENTSRMYNALAYGWVANGASPSRNANIVYAAKGNTIYAGVRDASGTWTWQTQSVGTALLIKDIVIDPEDARYAFAVDSDTEVWGTIDGGQTWAQITGDLTLRNSRAASIEVVRSGANRILLVGGNAGVFRARINTLGNVIGGTERLTWAEFGKGLPNAIVTDIDYVRPVLNGDGTPRLGGDGQPLGDILIVGTHGRGAWSIDQAASKLIVDSALNFTSDAGSDTVRITRNADNPLLLNVEINGTAQPTLTMPVSSIRRITFNGGDGADRLIIDSTNGVIDPPSDIQFDGQGGIDTFEMVHPNQGLLNGTIPNTGYLISDDHGVQFTTTTNIEDFVDNGISSLMLLDSIRSGLLWAGDWSGGAVRNRLSDPLGGLGGALTALNGSARALPPAISDTLTSRVFNALMPDDGDALLRRIFEAGTGGFSLDQIGKSIGDVEALRTALDNLDATPNNVTFTQEGGETRFDMVVVKTLTGDASLDVNALGGALDLSGSLKLSAQVRAHLVFGVNSGGFFIDPSAPRDGTGAVEPEITLSNISATEIVGQGRFGLLEVSLSNGSITTDPSVKVSLDLQNPGTNARLGGDDHLVRLHELSNDFSHLFLINVAGNAAGDDITLSGDFAAGAVLPGGSAPFELVNARVSLTWADIEDPTTVSLSVGAGAGSGAQQLIDFVQRTSTEVISGLHSVSGFLHSIANEDLLGTRIPLIDKSLSDILGQLPAPLVIENTVGSQPITSIGQTYTEGGQKKFLVYVQGMNLLETGIGAGDTVSYRSTLGTEVEGQIESVGPDQFIIRYNSGLTQDPSTGNPFFEIRRRGQLEKSLDSVLSTFNDLSSVSLHMPTLQGIIREIARVAGVDPNSIPISFNSADGTLTFSPTFNLDPLTFTQPLDFGTAIPGLSLTTSGEFTITVQPTFHIGLGLSLNPATAWEDRFFIVQDGTPEASLSVTARLDDLSVHGAIGFLDVILEEDSSVSPNTGISLTGTATLNMTDPSADGHITISELAPADLSTVYDFGITGTMDIDPIKLRADVAGSTLGSLTLQLNNYSLNNLTDLQNLPSALVAGITGNLADFTDFNNITPQMIIDALQALIQRLHDMGVGGDLLDQPLPLINKSISQIVDMGDAFLADLGSLDGVDNAQVLTAKAVEAFLETRLAPIGVDVIVADGSVRFDFDFHTAISETFPFAFDLGNGQSFISLSGSGALTLTGSLDVGIGLGFRTDPGLDFGDRIFLGTSDPDELRIQATGNIGYDLDGNGTADNAPFNLSLSGFGRTFSVVDGRALIDLDFTGNLLDGGNGDDRLTINEIISNVGAGTWGNMLSANFDGTAQAIVPIDGDGDSNVSWPAVPTGADARIEVGGTLANLVTNGITFRSDPTGSDDLTHNANAATPLSSGQLPSSNFVIAAHNLEGFVSEGLLNFDSLFDGLEQFLSWGQDMLGINLLDFQLPIVGKTPREIFDIFSSTSAGSIRNLVDTTRTGGAAALGEQLSNAAVYVAADLLRDVLNGIPGVLPIGDGDRDGTVEINGDDLLSIDRGGPVVAKVIAGGTYTDLGSGKYRLTKAGATFLADGIAYNDVVHYTSGSARTGHVTKVDDTIIEFQSDAPGGLPDVGSSVTVDTHQEIEGVTFLLKFQPSFSHTEDFDAGFDFLDLSASLGVTFSGDLTVLLGFGINKTDGFFLKTDFSDVPMSGLTASSPEISLNGRVEVNASTSVDFGIIQLDATMAGADNFLEANLGVNLSGLGDGKLTMAELINIGNLLEILGLGAGTPGITLDLQAKLDILLETSIIPELPSVSAHFVIDWSDPSDPGHPFDVFHDGIPTPSIEFRDVSINLGEFLNKIAGEVFKKIDQYNVLKPVIDVMDDEIPIIGKTLFELLIEPLEPDAKDAAMFLFNLARTISQTAEQAAATGALVVNLGDFTILEAAPGAPGMAPAYAMPGAVNLANLNAVTSAMAGASDLKSQISNPQSENSDPEASALQPPLHGTTVPGEGLPIIGGFLHDLGHIGITFPILDIGNLVKLLMGQDVDLVFVNLPRIEAGIDFNITFPLFSYGIPLIADIYVNAFVGGGFSFFLDLDAGLDTRGIRTGNFLDGFYLADFNPGSNGVVDPTDEEKYEVGLNAEIFAGVDAGVRILGLPVAHLTGQGTIGAEIGIDLNDDNQANDGTAFDGRSEADRHDGKFHFDEIGTVLGVFGGNILCLFDLGGRLYARLDITAEVNLLFFSWSWSWGQEWTLLEFEVHCEPTPPDLANLVPVSGGQELRLTSTSSTDYSLYSGSNNPEGDIVDVNLIDKNQVAEDGLVLLDLGSSAVSVTPPSPGGATFQVAAAAAGAQWRKRGLKEGQRVQYTSASGLIFGTISSVSDTSMTITMDHPATDAPSAGSSFKVFSGKETLRVKKEHATEDFGPAEPGANNVDVNNIKRISDEGGDLGGFGEGNDHVTIDPLIRVPVRLSGGGGADTLTGGSAGATLLGGDGNDVLGLAQGGAPADLTPAEFLLWNSRFEGGAGDDILTSGPGNDILLGGEGNDTLDAGAAIGTTAGGTSGNDTVVGGGGDDFIEGHNGNNVLVGDYDEGLDPLPASVNDRLEGKDVINADNGADRMWGDNRGLSNATDGTAARPSRQSDNTIGGGAGNDTMFGGSGSDQIDGADGSDLIYGMAGNDGIEGGNGDDTIIGGEGSDAILGGVGANKLLGGWHHDIIRGGTDAEYIEGGPDNDSICADSGADTIFGGTSNFGLPYLGPDPAVYIIPGGVSEFTCDSPLFVLNVPPSLTDAPATVRGQKFNDLNGDGVQQAGETGMAGWTIQLVDSGGNVVASAVTVDQDLNQDGSIDPQTETGIYSFTNLAPGDYTVREVAQAGWTQTTPIMPPGTHSFTLVPGDEVDGVNFGNKRTGDVPPGTVGGTKFLDRDGDGKRSSTEPGMAGVTVYADLNGNGQLDPGEPSTVTQADDPDTRINEQGRYELNIAPGTYTIREVVPTGYRQTFPPNNGGHQVVVESGSTSGGRDFGNAPNGGTITGMKFNDLNRDGKRETGENGLPNWRIYLDLNRDGTLDEGEPSTLTAENGVYTFTNLPAGDYMVREVLQPGWILTTPRIGYYIVTLGVGETQRGRDFGNAFGTVTGTTASDTYYVRLTAPGTTAPLFQVYEGSDAKGKLIVSQPFASISSFSFDTGAGNDTVIIDLVNGNPIPQGGINFMGGAGQDTLQIVGTDASDSAVIDGTSNTLMIGEKFVRPSEVEVYQFDGGKGDDTLTMTGQPTIVPIFNGGTGQDRLILTGGTFQLPAGFAAGTAALNAYLRNGASADFRGRLNLQSLNLEDTSRLRMHPGGVNLLTISGFSISPTATLDLSDNDMIVHTDPGTTNGIIAILIGLLRSARNASPRWTGPGITSLPAVQNVDTGLAIAANNNGRGGLILPYIDGKSVGINDILIKYSWNGDADLNGRINADDYFRIDSGFLQRPRSPVYREGDFNFDGKINADDYFLIDQAFLNQKGQVLSAGTPRPPAATPASAGGFAFMDANNNGIFDKGEQGIPGLTVYLDLNNNAKLDAGERSLVTMQDNPQTPTINEAGFYNFLDLTAGNYIVREITPSTLVLTSPSAGAYPITLKDGEVRAGLDFGHREAGAEIHGTKFADLDGDGKRIAGEPGLAGVTIYLDQNNNGILDAGEISTVTRADDPATPTVDETGRYDFVDLPQGRYFVREVVPVGYVQTAPSTGNYLVSIVPGQPVTGLDFGNRPVSGRLHGFKWLDLNGDGKRQSGEPGLAGVTIFVDFDGDQKPGPNEPQTLTLADDPKTPADETGEYWIDNVPPTTVIVREVVPTGFVQTAPTEGFYSVKVVAGETVSGLDFGNRQRGGNLTGIKFIDLDGDGKRSAGEPGMAGVIIYLDLDGDGTQDPNEPATVTASDNPQTPADETGLWSFTDIPPGFYIVREVVPSGYVQTAPIDGQYKVDVAAGQTIRALDFGNAPAKGGITGTKWDDVNGNGRRDAGEPGLAGVRIYLDLNNNVNFDAGEPNMLTLADNPGTPSVNEAGTYSFQNLAPGVYIVREVVPVNYHQTFPSAAVGGAHTVTLQVNQVITGRDFGNQHLRLIPDGNDLINGQNQADLIWGDNDPALPPTIISTGGPDTLSGGADNDTIHGLQKNDVISGGAGNDSITGEEGDDILRGDAGLDTLFGNDGNDSMYGGDGNDRMAGNKGDDTYLFNDSAAATTDILEEAANEGSDTLDFSAVTSSATIDLNVQSALRATNLTVDLQNGAAGNGSANFENAIGSLTRTNTLTGNAANNRLVGGNLADSILGNAGNDTLTGNAGNDTLGGGADQDRLEGGRGNDNMAGNAGNDIYSFADLFGTDTITEAAAEGTDTMDFSTVTSPLTVSLNGSSITATSGANTATHSSTQIERVLGGLADDRFVFSDGATTNALLNGGGGSDTLDYTAYTSAITVDLNANTATGVPAGISNFENVDGSSTAANTLTGNALPNSLVGGAAADNIRGLGGNDTLRGNAGADTLTGGTGDDSLAGGNDGDTYSYADGWGDDIIDEAVGAGVDTLVLTAITRPLTEQLGSLSVADDQGNTIFHSGNQIESLAGGASDTLVGGNAPNAWTITGANQGTIGTLAFSGIENLTGGGSTDVFTLSPGGAISGTVSGGAGSDSVIGTAAGTTYNITGANAGNIPATITFTSIESLTSGAGNDSFIFSAGASLTGAINAGGGSDTLNYSAYVTPITVNRATNAATGTGGANGIETVIGGAGSDTLIGAGAANTFNITANNAGNIGGTFTFSSIENLTGGAAADTFILSAGVGVSGIISGAAGTDTLNYSAYVTPVSVNLAAGTATGTGGISSIETFIGGTASDTLTGANAASTWNLAGANAGTITGGFTFSSFENLRGGTAADTFVIPDGASLTGTIDGLGGSDTLSYAGRTTAVTVNLQTNAATATGGASNLEALIGSSASDTLVGRNVVSTWNLTGANAGNYAATFTYAAVENLTGGSAADTFVFASGAASVSGIINGGAGNDTLDYTAYPPPVSVNLGGGTATGTGGIVSIEAFIAPAPAAPAAPLGITITAPDDSTTKAMHSALRAGLLSAPAGILDRIARHLKRIRHRMF